MEDHREIFTSLDQEARLYSGMLMEKIAGQLDLAYRSELTSLEAALQRAEQRVANLETRIADLEKKSRPD